MKRSLFLTLLFAAVTLAGMAQSVGEAFYIYRNDGDFNAFFRDEVLSIEYSYLDAEGNRYEEIVSQIVNTTDSVYIIPLAAIDSVGFVQPEIKLQPNVLKMDNSGLMDYLVAVDDMSLLFKPSLPNDLKPKVGEVLLYTDFNSSLLPNGFVGKVLETKMQADAFRVDCDPISDIFDIFEQLVAIEKVEEIQAAAKQMVDGEWISSRNPVSFNLGYSHPLSNGQVSLSGSVDGTYIATIAYNISREEQYINVKVDHDWQYGAHLNFKCDKGFGTLKGPVASLPAFRFPAIAPVFKFQISGAPFVKGEGNMELDFSLNSPVHSYAAQATYRNGHFSGWNHKKPVEGSNTPNWNAAFSLNGSLQAGYMVDFWLGLDAGIKGIAEDLLKLGTGIDFYIGPKLTGDFTMQIGSENPVNYYSLYKDSKLGLSLLTVDYEFFGEAAFAGHKLPRGVFCNGTFQTPLYHEWFIMPEFSDIDVVKNDKKLSATISSTPTRDIAFPLRLGMGLYDEDGKLEELAFEASDYKRENEGYTIRQEFTSLQREKEYEARPMVKILGGEIPALPTKKFKMENAISVYTLSANSIDDNSAIVGGRVEDFVPDVDDGEVGFFYNTTGNPSQGNGQGIAAGRLSYFADGEFLKTLSDLEHGKTYYYCAYYYSGGKYIYGEPKSFTTKSSETACPDGNHPHMIDLGLPSGTKWACCNVGASAPEQYGGYYAWGETHTKSVYNWHTYQYGRGWDDVDYIGSDIAGTGYDAATANWGAPWRMPSLAQCEELINNTTSTWTTQNGVNGRKFTGPNGGTIFLPAAGGRWGGELYIAGDDGDYWSSTLDEDYPYVAWYLYFGSGYAYTCYNYRIEGHSVRPVRSN